MKIRIITIIGARPQIIKAAALSRAISTHFSNEIQELIVHTGQHYDDNMSEVFFKELGIPQPNFNLHIGSGQHGKQTAQMIEGIESILLAESADYVVLYGDTNSTLAGAVAASKIAIPVVHIEAGLRSFNKSMPEEINRIVCDHCATMLFSPTKTGIENLIREGFSLQNNMPFTRDNPGVYHCGDVMFDNSLYFTEIAKSKSNILQQLHLQKDGYILSTIHRNNNTDDPKRMQSIFEALFQIIRESNSSLVLPVHPRTLKMLEKNLGNSILNQVRENRQFIMISPVSFLDMLQLETHASMIITDSGGVQKEAYFYNKPCLILRSETEWKEIVEVGAAHITDANKEMIVEGWRHFSKHPPKSFPGIFGDGMASKFICRELIKNFEAINTI